MKNNKYVMISKNHALLDQFYMNLIPYLRTYSAGLWKKDQFLQEFLDPILTFKCPPPGSRCQNDITNLVLLCFSAYTAIFYQRMA